MHVGNCTDGPADYSLAGGGTIIQPPGASNDDLFVLQKNKQNLWVITGTKKVQFKVAGEEYAVEVTNNDIALLIQCEGKLSAVALAEAPHQEAPP